MKIISLISLLYFSVSLSFGQDIVITEGQGIGSLEIGQSFEEAIKVLGFKGELKDYDDYLAEELFTEDPDNSLECQLGFEYYIKYEHLLTLPVSYVFFNDNKVCQIMASSFPAYYFSLAKSTSTETGLLFWAPLEKIKELYGTPDLEVNYDSFILNAFFYFDDGISVNLREDNYRTIHIFNSPSSDMITQFKDRF